MRILVSGLLNVETTVAVRGFPIPYYPIDYPSFGVRSAVSGVGFNIAKALTVLGDRVDLCSFLGGDPEGRRVPGELEQAQIRTGRIYPTLQSTPASVVLYDPQGSRQIYCDLKDIQSQTIRPETLEAELESCDVAALCNINFNRALIREARRRGVTTATDVHVLGSVDDEYNRDFLENADILFLSHEGLPCGPEDFLRQLLARYRSRIIVLGMGAGGAMLLEGQTGEATMIPAYRSGAVVNTVGAGDALFSAFVHYYAGGLDARAALQRAVIFAGIKVGFNGAAQGFCREADIEEVLAHGIQALPGG